MPERGRTVRVLSAALLTASAGALVAAPMRVVSQGADEGTESLPTHERMLELLRESTSVQAPRLPDLANPKAAAFNEEAPIPPQCYTRTAGRFNPCYVCHQNPVPGRENTMADGHLQVSYAFSDVGMTNHWSKYVPAQAPWVGRCSGPTSCGGNRPQAGSVALQLRDTHVVLR